LNDVFAFASYLVCLSSRKSFTE